MFPKEPFKPYKKWMRPGYLVGKNIFLTFFAQLKIIETV